MSFEMMPDSRLIHPMSLIVAGPSSCGKSFFVKRLLYERENVIDGAPEKTIWCYGEYQDAYREMTETLSHIEFVEGIPEDLEDRINPSIRNMVIIDDLMAETSKSALVTRLFTKGSHHKNLSVIFITQNLFYASKEFRTISLNASYICLFKSARDKSQIIHLAKQMYPGQSKFMQESYNDATSAPHGYLFIDLKPLTPEKMRLRTNIFPGEKQFVYVPKV